MIIKETKSHKFKYAINEEKYESPQPTIDTIDYFIKKYRKLGYRVSKNSIERFAGLKMNYLYCLTNRIHISHELADKILDILLKYEEELLNSEK